MNADILAAMAAQVSRPTKAPVDFMWRDPETGLLYITKRMLEQYADDIHDHENVRIVPTR